MFDIIFDFRPSDKYLPSGRAKILRLLDKTRKKDYIIGYWACQTDPIGNFFTEWSNPKMLKRTLALTLLAALLLVLLSGCGAKEVAGLPDLSPSSLPAPVPAGSTQKIIDSLAEITQQDDSSALQAAEPSNVEFLTQTDSAVYQDGYLYVLSNSDFMILSAQGSSISLLSTTNFATEKTAEGDAYEFSSAIYVEGDRLAVVTNQSVVFEGDSLSSSAHSYAKIYDISDRTAPVQLANLGQDGVYQDSAVYNGMLYLISVDAFRLDSENLTLPTVRDNGADVTVPESRIYVCEKPANVAYTLVSSISLADGKRTDVCAFTDGNLYTSISESGIYLARPVSLSAEGEAHTETPYTVTDYATSVVTEIKKLSCGDSLTLLNSYNIEGQVQAMDAEGTNLRLVTSILRSDYQIFTDEKYGWSNRLDGEQVQKNLLWVLGENMQPILQSDDLLPDSPLGTVYFSADHCYASVQDAKAPLLCVDLTDPANPAVTQPSGLAESLNHLLPDGNLILNLYGSDGRLFLSRLEGDTFSGSFKVDSFDGGLFLAVCSEKANAALISLNGTAHLLTLDGEIREVGLPKISVHSGTTFLFENGYLYACAPDSVSAVDLKTAEVSAQLSFGVG